MKTTSTSLFFVLRGSAIISLFLLLLLIPVQATAQGNFRPGYIISLQGDTLAGYVRFTESMSINEACHFRPDHHQAATRYLPHQITGFGFREGNQQIFRSRTFNLADAARGNGLRLDSIKTPGQMIDYLPGYLIPENFPDSLKYNADGTPDYYYPGFMEVLFEGQITLYQFKELLFVERESFELHLLQRVLKGYHEKRTVGEFSLTRRSIKFHPEYIGVLRSLLDDYPGLQQEVQRVGLDIPSLVQFLEKYHQDQQIAYNTTNSHLPFARIRFGITTGIRSGHMNFYEDYVLYQGIKNTTTSSVSLVPGVGMEISIPRHTELVTFELKLEYVSSKMNPITYVKAPTLKEEYTIDFKRLHIPFTVHHKFLLPFNPSVYVGLNNLINLNSKLNGYIIYADAEKPEQESTRWESRFYAPTKYELGYLAGLGAEKELPGGLKIFARAQYEASHRMFQKRINDSTTTNDLGPQAAFSHLSLLIGVWF